MKCAIAYLDGILITSSSTCENMSHMTQPTNQCIALTSEGSQAFVISKQNMKT